MRQTCAHCPNMQPPPRVGFPRCSKMNGAAVPSHTKPAAGCDVDDPAKWETIFWRIPVHCPLRNDVVEKSGRVLPMAKWEWRTFVRQGNVAAAAN